jgi:hypothetical protein
LDGGQRGDALSHVEVRHLMGCGLQMKKAETM